MTGIELGTIRRRLGLSVRAFAREMGYAGHAGTLARKLRKMEGSPHPVATELSRRVTAYVVKRSLPLR